MKTMMIEGINMFYKVWITGVKVYVIVHDLVRPEGGGNKYFSVDRSTVHTPCKEVFSRAHFGTNQTRSNKTLIPSIRHYTE